MVRPCRTMEPDMEVHRSKVYVVILLGCLGVSARITAEGCIAKIPRGFYRGSCSNGLA
jgi:hypothetical protein